MDHKLRSLTLVLLLVASDWQWMIHLVSQSFSSLVSKEQLDNLRICSNSSIILFRQKLFLLLLLLQRDTFTGIILIKIKLKERHWRSFSKYYWVWELEVQSLHRQQTIANQGKEMKKFRAQSTTGDAGFTLTKPTHHCSLYCYFHIQKKLVQD